MLTLGRYVTKELASLGRSVKAAEIYAMNRAARTALVRTVYFVRSKYRIKKSVLMKQVRIAKASERNPYVIIYLNQKAIPLINFGAKQAGKSGRKKKRSRSKKIGGVKATIESGKRKLFKGAFIQTMPTGHRGVFFRQHAYPYKITRELFGPSARDLLGNKVATEEMQKVFAERLNIEFERNLNFRLSKK